MNITIDKTLLSYLAEKKLRLDDVLVLLCFVMGKIDLMRIFLWGRSGDQCTAFMQSLERKGLMRKLAPAVEDFDWDNYVLTAEGNNVYEDCLKWVSEGERVILTPVDMDVDPDELLVEFMALWPEGTRNTNGDNLRSHPDDIRKKLKAFVKKYKFSKETILKATEAYLNRQRMQGYAYCNQAMYFISKDNISKLAGECEMAERNPMNESAWEERM